MLKSGIKTMEKRGLIYLTDDKGRRISYTPWLGDCFAGLYDLLMEKNVFPKKFGADIDLHYAILREMLKDVENMDVLELAAGSGSAMHFLKENNRYAGTDISPSLLKMAKKKLSNRTESRFYLISAEDLAFEENSFDACLCIISFNFFKNHDRVVQDCWKILKDSGRFICCVPVPEKSSGSSVIRGKLFSENQLRDLFEEAGFKFIPESAENGALLYFTAIKEMI